jgi:hypothetical protein
MIAGYAYAYAYAYAHTYTSLSPFSASLVITIVIADCTYHRYLGLFNPQSNRSALLEIDEEQYKRILSGGSELTHATNQGPLVDLRSKGAKYCLSTHSFSNLRMTATISQNGFIPGSTFYIRAVLTEYTLPVQKRATVKAEIEYPDKTSTVISLIEEEPGIFTMSLIATMAGIYRFKILAEGGTYREVSFTREQILDGMVFNTGNQPTTETPSDFQDFCSVLKCLADDKGIQRYLKENNIDPKIIIRCVEEKCMGIKT